MRQAGACGAYGTLYQARECGGRVFVDNVRTYYIVEIGGRHAGIVDRLACGFDCQIEQMLARHYATLLDTRPFGDPFVARIEKLFEHLVSHGQRRTGATGS